MTNATATIKTPAGNLRITANSSAVEEIAFTKNSETDVPINHPILLQCKKELDAYFSGKSTDFSVSLAEKGTAFQKSVWKTLRKIPVGEVITYGELAQKSGYPGAARAVGTAMKSNPFPIIIPCHRVLPSDKSLGGYAGGKKFKKWLLENEITESSL